MSVFVPNHIRSLVCSRSKEGQGKVVPPFPVADQTLHWEQQEQQDSTHLHVNSPVCFGDAASALPLFAEDLVEVSSSGSGMGGQTLQPLLKNCLKNTFDPQQENIPLYKNLPVLPSGDKADS